MRFSVTELQRLYLEVLAFVDYIEIYKPRMDGARSPAKEPAACIGAFTSVPRVVEDFLDAGLPVYFIRPAAAVFTTSPPKILSVVSLLEPEAHLELRDSTPRFPTIFKGPTNTPMKHLAMHRYSRTWMVYKSPHDSTAVPISINPFQNGEIVPNASDIRGEAELLKFAISARHFSLESEHCCWQPQKLKGGFELESRFLCLEDIASAFDSNVLELFRTCAYPPSMHSRARISL